MTSTKFNRYKKIFQLAIAAVAFAFNISTPLLAHDSTVNSEDSSLLSESLVGIDEFYSRMNTTIDLTEGDYAPEFSGEIFDISELVELVPQKDVVYDVIIQPGHYGRTRGATGGEGKLTSGATITERELVAEIGARLASRLIELGLNVAVIKADGFPRPLRSYVFLSIHADASVRPCASGPSLGYDDSSDLLGMHLVAYALGTSLGVKYNDFMKDNFTVNLSNYYAFRHMHTNVFEGVLEIGELTCNPKAAKARAGIRKIPVDTIYARREIIADNLAYALDSAVAIARLSGK